MSEKIEMKHTRAVAFDEYSRVKLVRVEESVMKALNLILFPPFTSPILDDMAGRSDRRKGDDRRVSERFEEIKRAR